MKKAAIMLLSVVFIALLLTSCKPDNMTQEVYDLGNEAVSITEKYQDAEITRSEAESQIEEVNNKLSNLADDEDHLKNYIKAKIGICITNIQFDLLIGQDVSEDLAELRDKLS